MTPASEPTPDVVEVVKAALKEHRVNRAVCACGVVVWMQDPEDHWAEVAIAAYESARGDVHHSIRESRMDGTYVECTCGEVVPSGAWSQHAPTPEPTVKPEGVHPGCTGDYECPAPAHVHGCFTDTKGHCNEPSDHDNWPGRTEREVKAEALREAADDCIPGPPGVFSDHVAETQAWLKRRATALEQGASE